MKKYLELYTSFFKIGLFTFGGGYAMLPLIDKIIIKEKKWMTEKEVVDYYAISQAIPGVIAVNVSLFIGYKEKKILGALVSGLGIATPSIIIISTINFFIKEFQQYEIVGNILNGVRAGVCALLLHALIKLSKNSISDIFTSILALLAFFSVVIFDVSPIFIIIFSIAAGLAITIVKSSGIFERNKKNKIS